jgi:predicted AlkP superfamily phosphohydrolase/phosphomutase
MNPSPLVAIGWDGATWDLLAPWVQAGKLPHLARLMEAGSHGSIRSTPLPISPAAWSTIVTGQNPGRHGVFDWFERKPGSYEVEYVHTGRIGAKTLWQYFNAGGRRIGVFCPPMLYPAVPVDGFMVSGMAAPSPEAADFAYPAELMAELETAIGPYQAAEAETFKVGREQVYLEELLGWLRYQRRAVRYLVERRPCDAYLLVFMQSDHAQHKFWRYLDPGYPGFDPARDGPYQDAILQVYQGLDEALGELLDYFGEKATYILLSDHGAGPAYGILYINRWLREGGYLHLRRRPSTRLKAWLARTNMILRAYRLAAKFGLGGLAQRVSKPARNKVLSAFLSLDDIDWSRTRAYSRGAFGQIFVNLAGREPAGIVAPGEAYEQLVAEILAGLRGLANPQTGEALITDLHRREEILPGPCVERAADILFTIQGQRYQSSVKLGLEGGSLLGPSEYEDSGSHRPDGILVLAGPGIQPGADLREANVADILPTLLTLADLPVPAGLDGRVLAEVFTPRQRAQVRRAELAPGEQAQHPGAPDLTPEERAQLERRLRSLGYLG